MELSGHDSRKRHTELFYISTALEKAWKPGAASFPITAGVSGGVQFIRAARLILTFPAPPEMGLLMSTRLSPERISSPMQAKIRTHPLSRTADLSLPVGEGGVGERDQARLPRKKCSCQTKRITVIIPCSCIFSYEIASRLCSLLIL